MGSATSQQHHPNCHSKTHNKIQQCRQRAPHANMTFTLHTNTCHMHLSDWLPSISSSHEASSSQLIKVLCVVPGIGQTRSRFYSCVFHVLGTVSLFQHCACQDTWKKLVHKQQRGHEKTTHQYSSSALNVQNQSTLLSTANHRLYAESPLPR